MRAIRNGLMISVGFQGVYIIVDFFLAGVGPAATALTERFGGVFTYTDIGWGAYAAFAFGHPIAYAVIAISLAVNLLLIVTNLTDTLNLNIWDTVGSHHLRADHAGVDQQCAGFFDCGSRLVLGQPDGHRLVRQ